MVAQPHVIEPESFGFFRHFRDRRGTVAVHRMNVKYAAQVFPRDQLGERMIGGVADFAKAFACLGGNVVQAQRAIDFRFVLARDVLLALE